MREELNSALGIYSPTFLKMYVDSSADLKDINTLSDNDSASYLHEYIHFLQDITTTFGYMNISAVVDYIKHVNHEAINDGKSEFKVPFQPIQNQTDFVYYNSQLRRIYLGSSNPESAPITINNIQKHPKNLTFPNNSIQAVQTIIISYIANGTSKQYEFGSQCISESMAIGIEQQIYPNVLPKAPELPYNSAKLVADFLYPTFSSDPLNIIALCDASLLNFHPGLFFYESLNEMKNQSYYPKSPDDIYNFIKQVKFTYQNFTTLNQLLLGMGLQASQQLSGYFTTQIFKSNIDWINNLTARAIDLRLQIPNFILDLTRMGKIQSNPCFASILNNILGTPFVVNNNHEACFYSPLVKQGYDIHPEYFWAINQIYKTYLSPITQRMTHCELKLWCQNSCSDQQIPDYTDDRCWDTPWSRASDKQLCIYGQVWRTWGLHYEAPV